MCLWCEVEERVYRSYEEQERKALEEIEKIRQECPAEVGGEECPDRPRCVWEKKLEFVVARMQRERLATEMAGAERCPPEKGKAARASRKIPAPKIPAHLLLAFERYIETMFERLTPDRKPASPSRRRSRKLIPFDPPGDSVR